jgi:hypothetical protein
MPSNKQIIRDKDYYGDYQQKSRYTVEQWEKILTNENFVNPTELALLKEIFASQNHAASLSQLSFRHKKDPSWFFDKMNQLGEHLGAPNGFSSDVDLEGNEYWWYLLFWGRNTKMSGLEWKLIPELAEAMEYTFPEMEDAYNSYMTEIERSEQIRYSKEDSVWIAAALLLYEKYYTEHPTDLYDLLLMQYEVQQRAQKVHGQDVDVDVITDTCNSDFGRCQYHYLRDIDKYWRVTYPGEIEDVALRPENIDYQAYIESRFGYIKLTELCEFIENDYCKIADPNYIEVDESNPFYKIISFLRENGQSRYMDLASPTEEDIERFLALKERGKEALSAFHDIGTILTSQYPSFVPKETATWLERDNVTIRSSWLDSFVLSEYENAGPALSVLCSRCEEAGNKIVLAIVLSCPIESTELTDKVMDKCNNLTVLTSADFRVEKTIRLDTMYSMAFGNAIAAYASFEEAALLDGSLEEVQIQLETAIQILASYYMDLCETVYHVDEPEEEEIVAPVSNGATSASTVPATTTGLGGGGGTVVVAEPAPAVKKRRTNIKNHEDRKGALEEKYPKNILFTGPEHCGKMKNAIRTAVGIIEEIDPADLKQEKDADLFKRFEKYREDGRILYSGSAPITYEQWMEGPLGEGRFPTFANGISDGNAVWIAENVTQESLQQAMGDAFYLLEARKREGQAEYETVSLLSSLRPFSLPSNLYFIGTVPCGESFGSLISMFHCETVQPKEETLTNLVVKGIPVVSLLTAINKRLSYLLGSEYQIGHLFFAPLKEEKTVQKLGDIMYGQILPQVIAWMKEKAPDQNPYEKARLVFGDFKKSRPDYEMILASTLCGAEIFGGDLEMSDKVDYRVQKEAFYEVHSYLEMM